MPSVTRPAVRVPNFFVAGVSKAGTTSLHSYLNQHPQIFMSPIKEPTYFGALDLLAEPHRDAVLSAMTQDRTALQAYLDGPQKPANFWFIPNWDDYLRLFRDSRDEAAIGESSTGYLWLPSAAGAIRAKLPDARVAFVLRDPAERLFTLYARERWRDPRITFRAWFQAIRETPRHGASTVGAGRYATHLRRFYEAFPRARLRVYLYEDYRTDTHAVLRDLFAFLGVSPDHPIDVSRRQRETVVPRFPRLHALRRRVMGDASPTRWLPEAARRALSSLYQGRASGQRMDPADRRMAIDYYRDEILQTGDLIGRDLSPWLR